MLSDNSIQPTKDVVFKWPLGDSPKEGYEYWRWDSKATDFVRFKTAEEARAWKPV